MYTELILGAQLRSDTPVAVAEKLTKMVNDPEETLPDDDQNPLHGASYYFGVSRSHATIVFDDISKGLIVEARANIKNYGDEIEHFLEWLRPHVDSGSGSREFFAIVTYEEQATPTIWYLHETPWGQEEGGNQ
jgi:hypothetical protein